MLEIENRTETKNAYFSPIANTAWVVQFFHYSNDLNRSDVSSVYKINQTSSLFEQIYSFFCMKMKDLPLEGVVIFPIKENSLAVWAISKHLSMRNADIFYNRSLYFQRMYSSIKFDLRLIELRNRSIDDLDIPMEWFRSLQYCKNAESTTAPR